MELTDSSRRRVLIADNNADLARALGVIIGYENQLEFVGHVPTGAEALEKVRPGAVDVLVLDLALDDRSGFDVLGDVRAQSAR